MAKKRKKNTRKSRTSKGFEVSREKDRKINAPTAYHTCKVGAGWCRTCLAGFAGR